MAENRGKIRIIRRVLFGTDHRTSVIALGTGLLLGVAAMIGYPMLTVEPLFWVSPLATIRLAFTLSFTLLAAGVAYEGGGLLASWWVNFPAHLAVMHYVYTVETGGFVVVPKPILLTSALVSGVIVLPYAVVGYLLGYLFRRVD